MTLRAHPLRAFPILVAFFLNVVVGPLAPLTQLASAPVLALSGSSFDATDGNFVVNGGETDWCSASLAVTTKNDLPTGQTDDSYAEGAKESDLNPPVETGSIPNNKVDLTRMYVAGETGAGGDLFVYVGWLRSDDNGTGTISFEMNQSGVVQSNGVNPERTVGDLLITFNFHGGGFESLTVREWDGSDWGAETDLVDTGLGEGSVNADDVVDCNGADVPALHFGEFSFNLTDLIGGDCRAFANIFAKSRASNAIESKLKELIKPAGIDLSTCGQITILKEDSNGDPLGGATFSVDPNPFTGQGTLSVKDNNGPDDNDAAGVIHLSDVEPGDYEVCETDAPAGYILDDDCQTLTVAVNGSAEFGPWVNGLGQISWQKVDEQSGDKICCASFTLEGDGGAADGFSLNVTDNGLNDEDPDAGELLVSGLLLGHYTITEVTPPTGYDLADPASMGVQLNGESASPEDAFQDAPRRDPSVEKTAVVDPVVAGHDASFDIVVTAGGVGDSENVVLSDDNPAGSGRTWAVSGANAGACADLSIEPGESLSCDFGTIENGKSRTVRITMTALESDCQNGIANTATITADDDVDLTNNESSAHISVLCPNPGVVKTADADPIVFGDPATFTMVVTAGGSSEATGVVLTDENTTDSTWAVGGANAAACDSASVAPGETLTCDFGTIPAGQSRTVTITATSTADDCDEGIANTASITADDDVDTSNNESSADITVLCPNPGVVKTADADPITAGDPASFTIVVSAAGSGTSKNVVLTDINETDHTWNVSGANANDCDSLSVAPGEDLVCDFGNLPKGQSRTVTISMTSDVDDCEAGIANTATISADADVDTTDNESSAHITVECPALTASKTADGSGVVSAGKDIGFTIQIENSDAPGTGTAKDVTLNDPLPAGFDLDWSELPDNADCAITGQVGAQTLECSFGDLGPGDSVSVHIVSGTSKLDCTTFPNEATVEADNHATLEPRDDVTVECPGLNISKLADNGQIVAGETASYTVVVWNAGPGTALDASFSDDLPMGVSWSVQLLDPDGDDACASSIDSEGNQSASCQFGDLPVTSMADGKQIVISGETDRDDCAGLDNTAFAFADNSDTVQASASIDVRCPLLVVEKAADTEEVHFVFDADGNVLSVDPEQVTWTLTYTLTDGPVTGAFISDPLPEFLVFVSATDGGDYDAATRTISWDLGDLTVDGSDDVSFVTTVDPDAPEVDPIVNVATIDSNETDPDDGEDSIIVTSESELGGNPTPTPSVPNTALVFGPAGEPISIPVELLAFILIGSLGTLAYANVRTARRRR